MSLIDLLVLFSGPVAFSSAGAAVRAAHEGPLATSLGLVLGAGLALLSMLIAYRARAWLLSSTSMPGNTRIRLLYLATASWCFFLAPIGTSAIVSVLMRFVFQ